MSLVSRKSMNAMMLIVGLLFFAYAFYLKYQSSTHSQDNTFANEVVTHDASVSVKSDRPISTEDKAATIRDANRSRMTLAEFQELTRWDNERGYFSRSDEEIYNSYSEQTLKDLSSSGDVKAMFVLGRYYIQKDFRPEESTAQYYKAVVYGASAALPNLAFRAQSDMIRSEADKTPEGRELGVTEIMAYYKVAAMRGDPRASIANINAYREVYKVRYGQELVLSQEQLDKIDLRARAIYDELLQRRHELGLGDFDNSTPESVKKDYEDR